MKATLIALFVAVLLVGCGRNRLVDYYENGQKKWERSYKDRQLIGPVTWWYESGQKKKELHHKYGGKMHGPANLVVRERTEDAGKELQGWEVRWAFHCLE